MNYNMIAYLLGNILHIEGILLFAPIAVAFYYGEGFSGAAFMAAAVTCLIAGAPSASVLI